jgi:glycosyltransferase involved in cell wall biosynthesis
MNKKTKVLFLVLGDIKNGLAPSSRFRVYAYKDKFDNDPRFKISIRASYPSAYFYEKTFFKKHSILSIFLIPLGLLIMFLVRLMDIFYSLSFDIVFIQRPLFPGKPFPLLELILSRVKNKHVIFDFDDSIFIHRDRTLNGINSWLYNLIEYKNNVDKIIQNVRHVVVGNTYLSNYALKYNDNVTIIPTPIDADYYVPSEKKHDSSKIIVGWIGTSGNLSYLEELQPVLLSLQRNHDFILKIVSNSINRPLKLTNIKYEWKEWRLETELEDLLSFDIGIMPLVDNEWTKGKCGFKLLQYMSCEIPVVTSAVGTNLEIVQDGENGFVAFSMEDWKDRLEKLLTNEDLRQKLGKKGRDTILSKYSIDITYPKLTEVLNKIK